jgi:E3 ubiquitin ligase
MQLKLGVLLFLLFDASGSFWLVLVPLVGAIAGVFLFLQGFRMLRFKRLILNTPLSKIHSASIGLVEVTGTPVGPQVLSAPITGDPCYYYRARAWQWEEAGKDSKWRQVLDESMYVPFFLEDGTGKVLIDPQGAEMDVHRNFSDEIGTSFFGSRDLLPDNIRNFLVQRGLVPYNKIKLEESIIKPEFPLFVFGTLGENRTMESWLPLPHISGGRPRLQFRFNSPFSFDFTYRNSGTPQYAERMDQIVRTLPAVKTEQIALGGTSPTGLSAVGGRRASNQLLSILPPEVQADIAKLQSSANRNAAANCAVISTPERDSSAAFEPAPPAQPASAPANKGADGEFNLHASAAIGKGERHEPFTISWHSQREVAGALAWKSALYIWGGPVLTLICVYFLLTYWGWIS